MKKYISFVLIFVMVCCNVFSAFGENTVQDAAGRTVTIESDAKRIISCYYISTASLLALGCREQIIGIEKKADTRALYHLAAPEFIDLPAVGSGKEVNLETILALDPDVVILPMKLKDAANDLAEFGIAALLVNPEDENGFHDCVKLLGDISGKKTEAENLLKRYDEMNEKISEKLSGVKPVSVYMSAESDPLMTYPADMYQDRLIEMAGGVNVAGSISSKTKVAIDPEQLLVWDPDVIIIVSGAGYGPEAFLENEQFEYLSAVQNGKVFCMPEGVESWDYPTPSSILGTAFISHILHPDLYSYDQLLSDATGFYYEVYGIETDAAILGLSDSY